MTCTTVIGPEGTKVRYQHPLLHWVSMSLSVPLRVLHSLLVLIINPLGYWVVSHSLQVSCGSAFSLLLQYLSLLKRIIQWTPNPCRVTGDSWDYLSFNYLCAHRHMAWLCWSSDRLGGRNYELSKVPSAQLTAMYSLGSCHLSEILFWRQHTESSDIPVTFYCLPPSQLGQGGTSRWGYPSLIKDLQYISPHCTASPQICFYLPTCGIPASSPGPIPVSDSSWILPTPLFFCENSRFSWLPFLWRWVFIA